MSKEIHYDSKRIAQGLIDTALAKTFDGISLTIAKNWSGATDADCDVLNRWLRGEHTTSDSTDLQDIGNRILLEDKR